MKFWQLNFEVDEYDNLMANKVMSVEELQSFDGRSKKSKWIPINVKRMEPKKGLKLSNAPGFSIPVFDKKALDILLPMVENEIEVLPLLCEEREFFAINVIKVLDCVDYDKSKYRTFRDGKRIMAFEKYTFKLDDIKGSNIFKIIDEPRRKPFVSDEFRDKVLETGLTGFKFKLVWDSEDFMS